MSRILLVPDLPLERSPSMDRYAHRLFDWLESTHAEFDVRLAASIGELTRERTDGRRSGGFVRWWTQPVRPSRIILPGPLLEPQRYAARHVLYPWRLRREARRAQLVHILDHSYAHMVTSAARRPVVVTVHDLLPVIVLRSPTDGWRDGLRNRLLRQALKALRRAQAYIVPTQWLKRELATWLGDDRRIHVVPFGVDRSFFSESPGARTRGRAEWRSRRTHCRAPRRARSNARRAPGDRDGARLRAVADVYLLQVGGRFTSATAAHRAPEPAALRRSVTLRRSDAAAFVPP